MKPRRTSRDVAKLREQGRTVVGAVSVSPELTHEPCNLLGGDMRSRERTMLKLGLASQESMYFIPPSVAAKATLIFPPDSALDLL